LIQKAVSSVEKRAAHLPIQGFARRVVFYTERAEGTVHAYQDIHPHR